MSKIVAIGPKDAILCFAVLGAELRPARGAEELSAELIKASREEDISLVLVPEDAARGPEVRGAIEEFRAESDAVLFLLPCSAEGPDLAFEVLGKEVERAVGMNLLASQAEQ